MIMLKSLNIHGEGFRLVVKTVENKKSSEKSELFFLGFFFIRPTKD
jgi:hypothetical protein